MNIPFVDFSRQITPTYRKVLHDSLDTFLDSGRYILSTAVSNFESKLSALIDSNYCTGVANGTDALVLSLLSAGVGPGDEVITTDLTAFPTITAIQQVGAIPVTVDIDLSSALIDTMLIESAITSSTKAIIPVHLYGNACNMSDLVAISNSYNLTLIEDCAQSILATWKGQQVGTFGSFGCFSFYPTKNLGAFGDAGAVACQAASTYSDLNMLRNYGQSVRYAHEQVGINSRLDELQAYFLITKLNTLTDTTKRRSQIAEYYLTHINRDCFIKTSTDSCSVHHLFPILSRKRSEFMDYLSSHGISTLIHYPYPVSKQKAFQGRRCISTNCSNSDVLASQIFSLPLYPELTDLEVEYIVSSVNKFLDLD